MTGPKLGYFDMNGDVEVFTQRVTEYLSVTPLHKRQWDTPSPCRCIGRLNVGVHFADATQRRASSGRRSRGSKRFRSYKHHVIPILHQSELTI